MDAGNGGDARGGATSWLGACRTGLRRLLGRRTHALAIAALLLASQAAAQNAADCLGVAALCTAKCTASSALGGLLRGGAKGSQASCRSACEQERAACERTQGAAAQSPAPDSSRAAARSESRPADAVEPTTPAGAESVVLLTVKPKDPFSSVKGSLPVAFDQKALSLQDARRHMRAHWSGPAAQHPTDGGVMLAIEGGPWMTRQKFVEATLAAYEKAGGARGHVRVDVLRATSVAATASKAESKPAVAAASAEALPASVRKLGCPACHSVERKVIGPTFRAIAAKYRTQPQPHDAVFEYMAAVRVGGHSRLARNDENRQAIEWMLAQ